MRNRAAWLIASLLTVGAAGPAAADGPKRRQFSQELCTSGAIRTCASVVIRTMPDPSGSGTVVSVTLRNLRDSLALFNATDDSVAFTADQLRLRSLNMDGTGPESVVPEPITLILLGSGLAGLGGTGMLRRRKAAL